MYHLEMWVGELVYINTSLFSQFFTRNKSLQFLFIIFSNFSRFGASNHMTFRGDINKMGAEGAKDKE